MYCLYKRIQYFCSTRVPKLNPGYSPVFKEKILNNNQKQHKNKQYKENIWKTWYYKKLLKQ